MADPRPLWEALQSASVAALYSEKRNLDLPVSNLRIAAELRAIAEWLLPEGPEPPLGVVPRSQINKCIDEHSDWREWFVRDCLRAELLAEADRAEAALAQPAPEPNPVVEFVASCKPLSDDALEVLTPEARWRLYTVCGPAPEPPTDEELLSCRSFSSHSHVFESDLVDFGRAVLARWGHTAP